MDLNLNFYSVTLLASGVAILILTFIIFRKEGAVTSWFGMVKLAIATWAIAYGLELMQSTLAGMLFWINIEYLGIGLLPAFWIIFIFHYLDKDKWITKTNLSLIFIVPILTILMVWTNSWHHLHYQKVSLDDSGPFALLSITPGIWYRIHTVFFYAMLGWGTILIIVEYRKSNRLYQYQDLSILMGVMIPWIVNMIYLFGLRPHHHIDLTPFGFILTAIFISFGLIKFRLFDIVPVARGKALEIMHEGVVILDNKYRILDFNDRMLELLKVNRDELVAGEFFQLWPDQRIIKAIEDRQSSKVKIDRAFNGETRFFEVSINPFGGEKAERQGTLLLFWDISQHHLDACRLSEQASELEELNRLKDKLISIISHDLRSPLASIGQMINLVETGTIAEKDIGRLLPRLSKNVRYTTELLDNLLYWSKSQMEGLKIYSEIFDIEAIIRNNITLMENAAMAKGIKLKKDINSKLSVVADKSMIDLVVRNLLSNAIKFSAENSQIAIGANFVEDQVIVFVADQGVGMAKEVVDNLFISENQSTEGTQNEKGAGLGLLLCRDFVSKNGGTIWAESELSKGSTFYFTLQKAESTQLIAR